MSAIDELLDRRSGDAVPLPAVPSRRVVVITCMDARIDVHRLLGLDLGEAHVLRNAGGLATEDALRSLVLSQRLLETREVMIIQHTRCGLLNLDENDLKTRLEAETGAEVPFEFGGFTDVAGSVAQSVETIRNSPLLVHRDEVRGFVFDVDSGELAEIVYDDVTA